MHVTEEWAEKVRREQPREPRVGHTDIVELKRNQAGAVGVFHRGVLVGWFDPQAAKDYANAFAALERTGRHGLVDAVVEPTSFKSGGATWVNLVQPAHYPAIPFNQPPDGIPRAHRVEVELKDERNYAGFIQQISRGMNASPGFFIVAPPDDDGDVAVYAPVEGRPLDGCRVGSVNKAGVKAARELTVDGPVYVPGIVWFRSTTPQIELAHWFG